MACTYNLCPSGCVAESRLANGHPKGLALTRWRAVRRSPWAVHADEVACTADGRGRLAPFPGKGGGMGWSRRRRTAGRPGRRLRPELPYVLAGVFIVFDAEQNHAARIARAARERWARYSAADRAVLASRVTLARVELGLPLVWRGCSEAPLMLGV